MLGKNGRPFEALAEAGSLLAASLVVGDWVVRWLAAVRGLCNRGVAMTDFYRSVRWLRLRAACFERDGFRCRRCGHSPDQGAILQADHIVPRSKHGKDALENLQTLCRDCNGGKLADDPTPQDLRGRTDGRKLLDAWRRAAERQRR